MFWDWCSSAVGGIVRFWRESRSAAQKSFERKVCSKEKKQKTEETVAREPETQEQDGLTHWSWWWCKWLRQQQRG